MPDAIALEVEIQMVPYLSYIISQCAGLLHKSAEASQEYRKPVLAGHKFERIVFSLFGL